jgi:hypothetical protein
MRRVASRAVMVNVALLIFFIPTPCAEPSFELQRGLELMQPPADYAAALPIFERILSVSDRSVAARAAFYAAYCGEKLGRTNAPSMYIQILREFPEQSDVVNAARTRLTAIGLPIRAETPKPSARFIRIIPIPIPDFQLAPAIVLSPKGTELYATGSEARDRPTLRGKSSDSRVAHFTTPSSV